MNTTTLYHVYVTQSVNFVWIWAFEWNMLWQPRDLTLLKAVAFPTVAPGQVLFTDCHIGWILEYAITMEASFTQLWHSLHLYHLPQPEISRTGQCWSNMHKMLAKTITGNHMMVWTSTIWIIDHFAQFTITIQSFDRTVTAWNNSQLQKKFRRQNSVNEP